MDNLDRMYRHLVRVIRSRFPQHLAQPFTVADLNQTILPYRLHRRELGLDTNDDYEITLTELVSGSRDYLIVDDQLRDTLGAALADVNPDPSAFKHFAQSVVALSPSALRSLDIGLDESAAHPPASPTPPNRTPRRLRPRRERRHPPSDRNRDRRRRQPRRRRAAAPCTSTGISIPAGGRSCVPGAEGDSGGYAHPHHDNKNERRCTSGSPSSGRSVSFVQ